MCKVINIYVWNFLVVTLMTVISISISGIQVVSKMFQWTEITMSIVYVIGELTHLFFLSLMAQFILAQSLNVNESAYTDDWYNMSAKIQNNIILILMRCRSPCQLTGGYMFVMSLETFCMMLQTSISYFTLLSNFR